MSENESDAGAGASPSPPGAEVPASDSALSSNGDADFTLGDNILGEDLDEQVSSPEGEVKPTEQATEATKPAVVATQPAPVAAAPKPASPAQAEAPKVAEATRTAQPPDLSSMPPDQLVGELARNREQLLDHLASQRFALTQQEKDALETDAVGAIPKLLARVYYEAATTALNQLSTHVPRIVESVTANLRTRDDAEGAFYSKYPAINRNDAGHAKAVQMAANVFRQNNPTATREQAIDVVGKMAMAMLGLQAPVANGNGNSNGNGARRPPAFTPAGGSARAVSSTQVAKPAANPFDGLGTYFDEQ